MADTVFVLMSSPEEAPYLKYYMQIFDSYGITYDIILWIRDSKDLNMRGDNLYIYSESCKTNSGVFSKFLKMIGFAKYANKIIEINKYKSIIVFTIQGALFINQSLRKRKGKYIIDIRDYSPILNVSLLNCFFKKIVLNSFCTVISSPGFIDFLPSNYEYIISHNINPEYIQCKIKKQIKEDNSIKVLTIGMIRDYTSNLEVIMSLAKEPLISMEFAGKGIVLDKLKSFVENYKINNILFSGSYLKKNEGDIVQRNDIINAYMPNNYNSKILLSNRLYLSVLYCKPIIVNKNSIQAEFVEKYSLGITITDCNDLFEKIKDFFHTYDERKFEDNCKRFLSDIRDDIFRHKQMVEDFINSI